MLIPGTPFVIFVDDMHGNGKKANEKDLNEIGYEIGQQSKKCPCEGSTSGDNLLKKGAAERL